MKVIVVIIKYNNLCESLIFFVNLCIIIFFTYFTFYYLFYELLLFIIIILWIIYFYIWIFYLFYLLLITTNSFIGWFLGLYYYSFEWILISVILILLSIIWFHLIIKSQIKLFLFLLQLFEYLSIIRMKWIYVIRNYKYDYYLDYYSLNWFTILILFIHKWMILFISMNYKYDYYYYHYESNLLFIIITIHCKFGDILVNHILSISLLFVGDMILYFYFIGIHILRTNNSFFTIFIVISIYPYHIILGLLIGPCIVEVSVIKSSKIR